MGKERIRPRVHTGPDRAYMPLETAEPGRALEAAESLNFLTSLPVKGPPMNAKNEVAGGRHLG